MRRRQRSPAWEAGGWDGEVQGGRRSHRAPERDWSDCHSCSKGVTSKVAGKEETMQNTEDHQVQKEIWAWLRTGSPPSPCRRLKGWHLLSVGCGAALQGLFLCLTSDLISPGRPNFLLHWTKMCFIVPVLSGFPLPLSGWSPSRMLELNLSVLQQSICHHSDPVFPVSKHSAEQRRKKFLSNVLLTTRPAL